MIIVQTHATIYETKRFQFLTPPDADTDTDITKYSIVKGRRIQSDVPVGDRDEQIVAKLFTTISQNQSLEKDNFQSDFNASTLSISSHINRSYSDMSTRFFERYI